MNVLTSHIAFELIEKIHADLGDNPFNNNQVNYEEIKNILKPLFEKYNLKVRHFNDVKDGCQILTTVIRDNESVVEWSSDVLVYQDDMAQAAGKNLVTLFSLWAL